MQYLGLLFTLTLLAVNLWGLMLVTGLFWRNRWFALSLGPLLAVTAVYAVECHHGLGPSLPGLELLSTLLSAAMMAFAYAQWEPDWLGGRPCGRPRMARGVCAPRAHGLLWRLHRHLPLCDALALQLSRH